MASASSVISFLPRLVPVGHRVGKKFAKCGGPIQPSVMRSSDEKFTNRPVDSTLSKAKQNTRVERK